MKILIIEDERLLAGSIKDLLEIQGFEAEAVYDGETGFTYAGTGIYDLIILDVMMPGKSGYEVARELRASRLGTPILMLTARSALEDRIAGLDAGADYYLTKPFDTKELLARITVQLRRAEQHGQSGVLSVGDLALDTETFSLTVQGQAVKLTRTEYAILKLLMENPRQVIAKSVLLDRISMDTPDCTQRSLKQHISNLRKKLQAVSGGDPIETVWGIGFRLTEQKS